MFNLRLVSTGKLFSCEFYILLLLWYQKSQMYFCKKNGKAHLQYSEAYYGPCQTSMIELSCKNSLGLSAVNYFRKKFPSYIMSKKQKIKF